MPARTHKPQAQQDTGYHDRRLSRRLKEDPEFRAEFERQRHEIAMIDAIVNQLDALREKQQMSKADLARAIGKNPAAIRRLLTVSGNPELKTVVAMAQALGSEVKIVPRSRARRARRVAATPLKRSSATRRTQTAA